MRGARSNRCAIGIGVTDDIHGGYGFMSDVKENGGMPILSGSEVPREGMPELHRQPAHESELMEGHGDSCACWWCVLELHGWAVESHAIRQQQRKDWF